MRWPVLGLGKDFEIDETSNAMSIIPIYMIQSSTPIRFLDKLTWSSVHSAEVTNSGMYSNVENGLFGD